MHRNIYTFVIFFRFTWIARFIKFCDLECVCATFSDVTFTGNLFRTFDTDFSQKVYFRLIALFYFSSVHWSLRIHGDGVVL